MGKLVGTVDLNPLKVKTWLPSMLDRLKNPPRRVETGLEKLDAFLGGGFLARSVNVMGSEPKLGKSKMIQKILEHHCLNGGAGLLIDKENGRERIMRRILQCHARLGDADMVELTEEQQARWLDACHTWRNIDTLHITELDFTRANFMSHAMAMRLAYPESDIIVVVDSLQKVADTDDRRADIDLWLRTAEFLRDKYGLCIIMVSELARAAGKKGNYAPQGRRYKESGDIEYTADCAISMWETAKPHQPKKGGYWLGKQATLAVDYNRDGQTGEVARYRPIFPWHGLREEPLETGAITIDEVEALADAAYEKLNHKVMNAVQLKNLWGLQSKQAEQVRNCLLSQGRLEEFEKFKFRKVA